MEDIYVNDDTACRLVKTKKERLQFLLDYSKSLYIEEVANGLVLESCKN